MVLCTHHSVLGRKSGVGTSIESNVELEENFRAKHSTLSAVDVIHCFILSANSNFASLRTTCTRYKQRQRNVCCNQMVQPEEMIPVGYSSSACW